jgi:hypothetical protein
MMHGENIATGASPTCSDCGLTPPMAVHQNGRGAYYIGTWCDCGPYSRESDYFGTHEEAEAALASGRYHRHLVELPSPPAVRPSQGAARLA